jgi:hypothetical protein
VSAYAWPAEVHAQVDASMEAGAARLRQIDIPQTNVMTLGGRLSLQGLRATLSASAIGANTPEGSWTGQGILSGSIYAPPLLRRRWELGASVGTFGATSSLPTVSGVLTAREHFIGEHVGAFVGASGGGIRYGEMNGSVAVAQVGGWWRVAGNTFSASASATDARSLFRLEVPGGALDGGMAVYNEITPVSYTDGVLYWQHERERLQLELGGGLRAGMRGIPDAAIWGSASATLWLAPRLALVAATGRALEDKVRGLPQTRYLSVSARVGLRSRILMPLRRHIRTDGTPGIMISKVDDEHLITVRAQGASTVEVMGDFTDWEPLSLSLAGDVWRVRHAMSAGSHRVAIRVDGGEWRVPANLPKSSEEFGMVVGVVSVP